jgi:hypothetical protein
MCFELFGAYREGNVVDSTKNYVYIFYYKIQYITKIIQKLGYHVSNLCFVTERNSKYEFLEFRWNIPLQINPKKFENYVFYIKILRRKNGTDLVSKPINWIWNCVLRLHRSFLLPHNSEHRSRKPLEKLILRIGWKSQGCIICVRQILWPGSRK